VSRTALGVFGAAPAEAPDFPTLWAASKSSGSSRSPPKPVSHYLEEARQSLGKALPPIVIISGPSCVGKTTLSEHMAKTFSLQLPVSHTTREIRAGEADGRDYYFVDKAMFDLMMKDRQFVESSTSSSGHHYGLSLSQLVGPPGQAVNRKIAIVVVDKAGKDQIAASYALYGQKVFSVLLLAQDYGVLARRLYERHPTLPGSWEWKDLATRLLDSKKFEDFQQDYDLVVRAAETKDLAALGQTVMVEALTHLYSA